MRKRRSSARSFSSIVPKMPTRCAPPSSAQVVRTSSDSLPNVSLSLNHTQIINPTRITLLAQILNKVNHHLHLKNLTKIQKIIAIIIIKVRKRVKRVSLPLDWSLFEKSSAKAFEAGASAMLACNFTPESKLFGYPQIK